MFSDESRESEYGSDDGSISIYGDGVGSVYGGASNYGGSIFDDEASDDGSGESVFEDEPPTAYVPRTRVYDSYDEDEDEDDSSIDDSELPRPPPEAYFQHYVPSDSEEEEEEDAGYHSARGYRSPVPPVVRVFESDSDSEDDQEGSSLGDEEDDFLPGRGRRGRSAEADIGTPEAAEDADDEGEGEDRPNLNTTFNLITDDDDDIDDEPPVRPAGMRSAAARWGWTPQDGEPPRGRSLSRRRIVSPEADSEYFSD